MAGASLSIEYDDSQVQLMLSQLLQAGVGLKPAFQKIGEELLLSHSDRFKAQEAPDGTAWAALNPKYLARKKKNKDKVLVLNGFLSGLLAYDATDQGLAFGTNQTYGATHQFGDDDRGIVARPFLGISSDDKEMMLDVLWDHLLG